ncbi:hypothetical protein QR680_016840 [Steinernema hermaphroditum]|uniref:Uncharacterized protein n=1 Tax=Steinernema hermaphroditum TaxID=289476 RepID=A0AA39HCV8_9BILA|nr:hypothetical protein QR680_016840 [Steinernema hermaphroditum]
MARLVCFPLFLVKSARRGLRRASQKCKQFLRKCDNFQNYPAEYCPEMLLLDSRTPAMTQIVRFTLASVKRTFKKASKKCRKMCSSDHYRRFAKPPPPPVEIYAYMFV